MTVTIKSTLIVALGCGLLIAASAGSNKYSAMAADQGTTAAQHDDHEGHDHGSHEDHDNHEDHDTGADHDDHGSQAEHEAHNDHGSHEGHDDHEEQGAIQLSAAELNEFEIELATAKAGRVTRNIELPGEVQVNADRMAHIVPRFPGIVTEVHANIGDRVNKGQVLAVIESDESLAPYEVRTLISGTVIAKHITLGEAASREQNVFVIADLSTVWIDLAVYQRDLNHIRVGQQAQVSFGRGEAMAQGNITYITPVVDEDTRTATARLVLNNSDARWRPGMFVVANVQTASTAVNVAVPQSALHTMEGRTVIFVQDQDGFEAKAVRVGREGETSVEILAGLNPGDRFVSRGGFTLKAEMAKSSFGHAGHSH